MQKKKEELPVSIYSIDFQIWDILNSMKGDEPQEFIPIGKKEAYLYT